MLGDAVKVRMMTFLSDESTIRISTDVSRYSTIRFQEPCQCLHGDRRMTVTAVLDPTLPPATIALSQAVAERLRLTVYGWRIPLRINERQFLFGPLIGILANPVWNSKSKTLKTSKQLVSLTRLCSAGAMQDAICVLFDIKGIDLTDRLVQGYIYHDHRWHKRTFPLPHVIYDQLVSRKLERDLSLKGKREALTAKYGDKFFNGGFFDKWQVYEWLSADAQMKFHVPQTLRHSSLTQAEAFVCSHAISFLKPLHGSLGLGIVRFLRHQNGSVTYEMKKKAESVTSGQASSVREALQIFRTRFKNRPYIWQEGLNLAKYHERPLDIRILMQRDETGEWKRTKMFARVAKIGDFTSNITGGGDAMPVDEALTECLPKIEQRNRAKRQIRKLSRQIVEAIESASGRSFGEMGIDLGVDTNGKIWIIEVNSKPHKTPATEKGRQDLVDLSFERPMGYALYLATSTRKSSK